MGILGEFLIISATATAGILLSMLPWFPLPGAVTGLILMLLLLLSGVVKLERVNRAARFFLKFLPLFFIPVIVNLVKEGEVLSEFGLKLIAVIFITTILTIAATGLTAKLMLVILKKRDKPDA